MNIQFSAVCCMSAEDVRNNMIYAHKLGIRDVSTIQRPGIRIAVVGGGPSAAAHIEEIRAFDGEVWAINAMAQVLAEQGIEATLFAADPDPVLLGCTKGVKKAILASACHPSAFDALLAAGAEVSMFDIGGVGRKMGPTTATAAPAIAVAVAAHEVVFYGCESSYGDDAKSLTADRYAGHHDNRFTGKWMRVACNGSTYLTDPELYMQAQLLSVVIRQFPTVFREKCGGLLAAMTADQETDTLEVSNALAATLTPIVRPTLAFRSATVADTPMLFLWHCDPANREARGESAGEAESFKSYAERLASNLSDPAHRILIFERDGRAVAAVSMISFSVAGEQPINLWCFVPPAYRRQGIGAEILTMMVTSAGAIPVVVPAVKAGSPGTKVVERLGFSRTFESRGLETWIRGEVADAA